MSPSNKPSPKVEAYLKEINEVGERYQFALKPTLKYAPQGILPEIIVVEVLPPKKEVAQPSVQETEAPNAELPKVEEN